MAPPGSLSLLFLSSLMVVSSATESKCNPSAFSLPSIIGTTPESIEARPVYNYTLNPHWTPEALSTPSQDGPSFCNVTLSYARSDTDVGINVQVWLPLNASSWNGRFIGVGGGGFATGELDGDHITTLLYHGYAAAATDGGHDYRYFAEAPWGLRSPGNTNWDTLIDYAYRSLHDLAVIGKAATEQYFGQAPEHSYWRGCSTGGRQGLIVAQRYPEDWDGILASCPAVNFPRLAVGGYWPQFVMNNVLEEYPHSCELNAIQQYAIEACDKLDGIEDGIIANPDKCDFNAEDAIGKTIVCEGENRNITKAAAIVANAFWTGPKSAAGEQIGFAYPVGTPLTGDIALANTICQDGEDGATSCVGAPFPLAPEWIRIFVAKDPDFDPISMTYDDYERLMRQSTLEYDGIIGSNNPDLSEFRRLGKKMITWHGINDETLSVRSMRAYYDRVLELDPDAADFYRYFEVPGVNHCRGGPGTSYPLHSLETLRNWVEKGIAPNVLDTIKLDHQGSGNGEDKGTDVCLYPLVAGKDSKCINECSNNLNEIRNEI